MLAFLFAIVMDCMDWISAFLILSAMLCLIKPIRKNAYPALFFLFAAIAFYPVLPVRAAPNLFFTIYTFPWQLINIVLFFLLLYGLKIHHFLPLKDHAKSLFFLYLSGGWFMIRMAIWMFLYFHASFDSPYIRFQINGPIIASLKAEAWNFHILQNHIKETKTYRPKTLQSETQFSNKQIGTLVKGLDEAESFRHSLLLQNPFGKTQAQALAQAIIQFQQSANPSLQDYVTLDDFVLEEQELINFISGNAGEIFGALSFELFNGKWYGKWDQYLVDHDWEPTLEFHSPIILDTTNSLSLRAVQYAWIGDGFGWNAVIAPEHRNTGDVILGSVYHVRNQNPDEIDSHRPHVGIPLDEGQLIWITDSEVFLEQAFKAGNPKDESYAITGFFYENKDGKLINRGDGFQAVYTRQPDNRPEWFRFPVEISIDI